MSRHLERIGDRIRVHLPTDENGYAGRECPEEECQGYFKVKLGTGLSGEDLLGFCPYCGYHGAQNDFFTQEQLEYAKSVAFNQILEAVHADLKDMEYNIPAQGPFGIGFSIKVSNGPRPPIRYYREKQLETDITCTNCTLEYAVYGVFAYCPDCGAQNSQQILDKNLELAEKEIALAATVEGDLAAHLVGDALENAVSAFDGFGRELCRVHAPRATNPAQSQKMSFQSLTGAQRNVNTLFGFDMAAGIDANDWMFAIRCFQKRHLLAHSMGVVDDKYIQATNDPHAVVGRKVVIHAEEVSELVALLRVFGASLVANISAVPSPSVP